MGGVFPSLFMDYVSDEAAAQARKFERKLQQLPKDAGLLFIGVQAVPASDGKSGVFEIRLGLRRTVGDVDGAALVKFVFREELANGVRFQVSTYRGVSGADRDDDGDEEAGTTPS